MHSSAKFQESQKFHSSANDIIHPVLEVAWKLPGMDLSCFRLTERNLATVVTDPYDSQVAGYEPLKLKADIVTVSHEAPGHSYTSGVKGYSHLINTPGEFEIGGVFITGIQTNGYGKGIQMIRATPCMFSITKG